MCNSKLIRHASMALAGVILGGCANTYDAPQLGEELVWTASGDEERPEWTMIPDQEEAREDHRQFVGISNRHSTQRGARDAAMRDAHSLVAQHIETEVFGDITEQEIGGALQSGTQDPDVLLDNVRNFIFDQAVSGMEVVEWRYEQWLDHEGEETFYKAFALTEVDKASFELDLDDVDEDFAEAGSPEADEEPESD